MADFPGCEDPDNLIGGISIQVPPLALADQVTEALRRFQENPSISALPVVGEDGQPKGIIHKTKLLTLFGQKYGFALFAGKSVLHVMESPLVIESRTPLEEVSLRVVAREEGAIYDAIVVVSAGRYVGTVQVYQILSRITHHNLQRMREEAADSAALLQLETRLRLARGPMEVCRVAVEQVPHFFPGTWVFVWLWNEGESAIRPALPPDESPITPLSPFIHALSSQSPGVFEKVIETEKPLVVASLPQGEDFEEGDVRFHLLLPLLAGGAAMGVLQVAGRKPGSVTNGRFELIQEIARQIGLSLYAERTHEEIQRRLNHISLLNQIVRAIGDRHDTESIFRAVLARLEEDLPVDFGGMLLYESSSSRITVAARGPKSRAIAEAMDLEEGRTHQIDETEVEIFRCLGGEGVLIRDTLQSTGGVARSLGRAGIRSLIGTPLIVEGKVIGLLTAGRREPDGFGPADQEFFRMLGEHVALAVHHAQLLLDLQQAYDDLRATQQTMMGQERLRALGQMASGIAHDINNLLAPIVGFSDLLLAAEPDISSRAQHYLGIIRTAGQDIAKIVSRMREFYRSRDSQETLAPVDLNGIVRQVIDLTRPRWKDMPQQRGAVVGMQLHLDSGLPRLRGVESELREAITNLVLNALDAMPSGGSLTVSTSHMGEMSQASRMSALAGPAPKGYAVLEVSDTGIGMDEDTQRRCLEPFYSTKGEHGTGLGLSMVFGIVKRHEGDIRIVSKPGGGTRVRLLFPVQSDGNGLSHQRSADPPSPSNARSLKVLFIDDEPTVRTVVRELLHAQGHIVSDADGGATGLSTFREALDRGEPFDVVITDLGMPYVDGREVARGVKTGSPSTPVILLTGWGSRMKSEGDLPGHVDYVMSKPPQLKDLQEALLSVSAHSRREAPAGIACPIKCSPPP